MARTGFVLEIVKDGNGVYYANLTVEVGLEKKGVRVLPEYVDYRTLRKSLADNYNLHIPNLSELHFKDDGWGRKRSSVLNGVADVNYEGKLI
jgi:hypothetical protein